METITEHPIQRVRTTSGNDLQSVATDSEKHVNDTPTKSAYFKIGTAKVIPRQNRIVLPDDSFVQIRPKSFDVLIHLCQHSGRLVEKESLVKAIWKGVCVTDDSLVQCIVDIRKSLGDNSKHLRTVTRRGYMITAELIDDPHPEENNMPSLIVGPFKCTDSEKDAHVASGLCDGVIARLLNNTSIKLQIKNAIAERDANYQVNCNLQFQGERARVAVQLLNRLNGQYVWANIYDNSATDAFSLQDRLSHDIAADLISQLKGRDAGRGFACERVAV